MKYNFSQPKHPALTYYNVEKVGGWGGQCYQSVCALFKHKDVFIGFEDADAWIVFYSSKPGAEWRPGCQNPWGKGSPYPQSEEAKCINFEDIPDEAKPLAYKMYQEAVDLLIKRCEDYVEQYRKRKEEELRQREEARQKEIVEPWLEAAEKEAVR